MSNRYTERLQIVQARKGSALHLTSSTVGWDITYCGQKTVRMQQVLMHRTAIEQRASKIWRLEYTPTELAQKATCERCQVVYAAAKLTQD